MNSTIDYFARQVAGSRRRLLISILCQVGVFGVLMKEVGWHWAPEFGLFMVLLPTIYLWIIHGMVRESSRAAASAVARS